MTRAERERLIERHLGGAMTAAEESDFFIQVALDKELRQDLKAQRTIESAMRKDRESEPSEHTALRSRVATVLAASSGTIAPSAQRAARVAAETSRVSRPARAAWMTRPVQWALASAAAFALTVGAVIVMPGGRQDIPAGPTRGAQAGEAASSTQTSPGMASPETALPGPGRSDQKIDAHGGAAVAPGAADSPPASVNSDGVRPGSAARAPRRSAHAEPQSSLPATRAIVSQPAITHSNSRDASSTASSSKPDRHTTDPARPRRTGTDSINVGARVVIKPHN
jgi:hypothetical protein